MPESTQRILREIRALGWTAELTKRNHIVARHPNASRPIYISGSPSCRLWRHRMERDMRLALKGTAA